MQVQREAEDIFKDQDKPKPRKVESREIEKALREMRNQVGLSPPSPPQPSRADPASKKEYACVFCDYSSDDQFRMKRHLFSVHRPKLPADCTDPNKIEPTHQVYTKKTPPNGLKGKNPSKSELKVQVDPAQMEKIQSEMNKIREMQGKIDRNQI